MPDGQLSTKGIMSFTHTKDHLPVAMLVWKPNFGSWTVVVPSSASSPPFGVGCRYTRTVLSPEHDASMFSVGDQLKSHARSVWPVGDDKQMAKHEGRERETKTTNQGQLDLVRRLPSYATSVQSV
jgi:hypothetical protein